MELTAFLHFSITPLPDVNGRWKGPNLFNPTELDAEQWVSNWKKQVSNGDSDSQAPRSGFIIWPTATTKHSCSIFQLEKRTSDVVKELKSSTRNIAKASLEYISPWDRNAECYEILLATMSFYPPTNRIANYYGEVHEVMVWRSKRRRPQRKNKYMTGIIYSGKPIHQLQPKQ